MPDDKGQDYMPPTTSQPVSNSQPAPQPKKSKTVLIIVSVVTVLLVATGMLAALLFLIDQPQKTANPIKATNLTTLGSGLKSSLKNPSNASASVYKTTNPGTVIYRYDAKNWVVADTNSSMMTFSSKRTKTSDNKSDYDAVLDYLDANDLTVLKTISQTSSTYSADKLTVKYFASTDFVCNLHNTPDITLNGGPKPVPTSYALQVDCAQTGGFKNNIAAVKPLATAYDDSKDGSNTKDPLFGVPSSVQTSATKDYKNTHVTIASVETPTNSLTGEFYQTPDKNWHFFMTTDAPDKIACSDYMKASDDVKKAFLGFTCLDDTTNTSSFVQQSQPTFEIVPGAISDK